MEFAKSVTHGKGLVVTQDGINTLVPFFYRVISALYSPLYTAELSCLIIAVLLTAIVYFA